MSLIAIEVDFKTVSFLKHLLGASVLLLGADSSWFILIYFNALLILFPSGLHRGIVVSIVKRPWFKFPLGVFVCGVCIVSSSICWFSLDDLPSSHSTKILVTV